MRLKCEYFYWLITNPTVNYIKNFIGLTALPLYTFTIFKNDKLFISVPPESFLFQMAAFTSIILCLNYSEKTSYFSLLSFQNWSMFTFSEHERHVYRCSQLQKEIISKVSLLCAVIITLMTASLNNCLSWKAPKSFGMDPAGLWICKCGVLHSAFYEKCTALL